MMMSIMVLAAMFNAIAAAVAGTGREGAGSPEAAAALLHLHPQAWGAPLSRLVLMAVVAEWYRRLCSYSWGLIPTVCLFLLLLLVFVNFCWHYCFIYFFFHHYHYYHSFSVNWTIFFSFFFRPIFFSIFLLFAPLLVRLAPVTRFNILMRVFIILFIYLFVCLFIIFHWLIYYIFFLLLPCRWQCVFPHPHVLHPHPHPGAATPHRHPHPRTALPLQHSPPAAAHQQADGCGLSYGWVSVLVVAMRARINGGWG